jgi:alpha-glucosidase
VARARCDPLQAPAHQLSLYHVERSNFTSIWPTFGGLQDFDVLVASAKALGLHIIMDFVPNHSSNQHPWFLQSRSSRTSKYRDWYIWHDGTKNASTGALLPPNNWRNMFCKDADCYGWEFDNITAQWYYHCFLKEQPDLNWRNPDVVDAMHDVLRFWLRRGVDGFRVDAFPNLLEDPQLRDEPLDPNWHGDPVADGYGKLLHTRTENQLGLHDVVRGMREVLAEFGPDKALIGEGWGDLGEGEGERRLNLPPSSPPDKHFFARATLLVFLHPNPSPLTSSTSNTGEIYPDKVVTEKDVISFYGTEAAPEFSFPFNFGLVSLFAYNGPFDPANVHDPRNATTLREFVDAYDAALPAWAAPNWAMANHDVRRLVTRLHNDTQLARVATALLLTLRGTPTVYNGEEFGQQDGYVPPGRRQDPNCKTNYEGLRCRDPQRTPLQWNADNANAGFSGADVLTWLPVSSQYVNVNAEAQLADPDSYLALFSGAAMLRQQEPCLHRGLYASLNVVSAAHSGRSAAATPVGEHVFAFVRYNGSTEEAIVVVANLGSDAVSINLTSAGVPQRAGLASSAAVARGVIALDSRTPSGSQVNASMGALQLQGSHLQVLRVSFASAEPEPRANKGLSLVIIVGAGVGGAVVLILAIVLLVRWRRSLSSRPPHTRSTLPFGPSSDESDGEARASLIGGDA